MKFRKKPVVIEAFRLPVAGDDNVLPFCAWAEIHGLKFESDHDEGIAIETPEGVMRGNPGDWIIKGVKGEFYPCKPDIFAATYEPVHEPRVDQPRTGGHGWPDEPEAAKA